MVKQQAASRICKLLCFNQRRSKVEMAVAARKNGKSFAKKIAKFSTTRVAGKSISIEPALTMASNAVIREKYDLDFIFETFIEERLRFDA